MAENINVYTATELKNALDDLMAQNAELAKAKDNLSKAQEDIRQIMAVLMAFKEGAFNNE